MVILETEKFTEGVLPRVGFVSCIHWTIALDIGGVKLVKT